VNPFWFARNVALSWQNRASLRDFIRRLLWIYCTKLNAGLLGSEWIIGFRYPQPVGHIRLLVRANAGADAFIHGEVFGHEYYRLPLATPPATILDLGANIGLTAVYFSRLYPDAQLACVEPIPPNLRLLKKNLELNAVRATVIAAAIDVEDGRALMELDPRDYAHRICAGTGPGSTPTLEVAAISVPTVRQRLGWSRIGLLKVDIEGHEIALFSDHCDWLELVDVVCIECHGEFGVEELKFLAHRFGFLPPRIAGGIWLLTRT
jgi:FkbM family methyltransferase